MDTNELESMVKNLKICSESTNEGKHETGTHETASNVCKQDTELTEIIKSLEIVFNWQPYLTGKFAKIKVHRLEEKKEEIPEENEFKFRVFIIQLALAYESFNDTEQLKIEKAENVPVPLQKINECEKILQELKRNNCNEPLFLAAYQPLMFHVILGSKMFLMNKYGLVAEAKQMIGNLLLEKNMTKKQLAALYASKAFVIIEYGGDYFRSALDYALEAKKMDPSIAEWQFLVGLIMGRIRHLEFTNKRPSEEEIISLEKAVQLSGSNIRFKVALAESYSDKAFDIYHQEKLKMKSNAGSMKSDMVNVLNQKCLKIYRQVVSMSSVESHALARCAFGVAKLPWPYKDVSLAKEAIEKALCLTPTSPLVLHYAGIIYDRYFKKLDDAAKFYKKAADLGNYGAAMDFARLNFNKRINSYSCNNLRSSTTILIEDLKRFDEEFFEKDHHFQIIANIAACFFFVQNDVIEAWKYLKEIVLSEPQHVSLRKLKAVVVWTREPFDFCDVILDEINNIIGRKTFKTETEKEILMDIRGTLLKVLSENKPKEYINLKKKILDKSAELRQGRKSNTNQRFK